MINTHNISNINLSEKNLEILYIGRLEAEKNIPYLLNSLSKLDNEFLLKIIGDGSLLSSLKQQALNLKISEKISWTNWQENPWTKVSEASILILPSNEDKCPLVLLESLAHGIPVICTNSKIKNKFITHGKNGWFIDSNDENSLVNLLKDIINNKISLPSKEYCKKTVETLNLQKTISTIESALLREIDIFKSNKN